jgi:hypothetical protein
MWMAAGSQLLDRLVAVDVVGTNGRPWEMDWPFLPFCD